MKRFLWGVLLIVSVAIVLAFYRGTNVVVIPAQKQRGVSWVAGPQPVVEADLEYLAKFHVNWIVQTPFGWQRKHDSPRLRIATDNRVMWGERDTGIEITTELAKKFGIKVILKPHIWLGSGGGKWRTDIEMHNEEDWQSWFENYRKFIVYYATLAQRNDIEALCVGTELHQTAVKREQDWRRVISEVRKVYHGKLTYAANWYKEFEEIKFWDALDFIGIQAYFPLTKSSNPTLAELKKGWQPHLKSIEKLSRKYNKPVIFTEIGYRSCADAGIRPWEWPARYSREIANPKDLQTQVNCYEAFFEAVWEKDWFAGAYFWKWFPKRRQTTSQNVDRRFTPQSKPAEKVIAKWYADTID
ncbi:MAG: hypothetical protein ACE5G1_11100 [bacterium]